MPALLGLRLAQGRRLSTCGVGGLLHGIRSWLAGAVKQSRLGVQGVAFHLAHLKHGLSFTVAVGGLKHSHKEDD